MTFRRLMLIVLPLLGAIFLFMILRYFYIDWESKLASRTAASAGAGLEHPETLEAMPIRQGIETLGSKGINLLQKDKDGRPEMQFLADTIVYPSRSTAAITGLRILFFHNNPANRPPDIITVMADHADMVTKGMLTNVADLRSAHLWGNTVLVDDRGTPDDHSDDILMGFQDLNFDNANSQLFTDGPVVVAGLEMNLTAHKMRIALKPTANKGFQIDKMTFVEDIFISLESKDRSLRGMAGPTAEPTSSARPTAVAAAPVRPAPTLSAPTSKTSAKSSRPPGERIDLWKIDLDGNVDARQGTQRVLGDHVTLFNGTATGSGSTAAAGSGGAAASPPSGRAPAAGGPPLNTEGSAAARAAFLQADASPPLVIIANGPLEITPITADAHQALGDEASLMIVTGRPVIIDDDQTHVVGEEVRYNSKTQAGSIIGRETPFVVDQPGRMHLTDLGQLDFKNSGPNAEIAATAVIRGEGQLHAVAQAGSFSAAGRRKATAPDAVAPAAPTIPVAPAVAAPPEPPSTIDASWTQGVRMEFYRLPADIKKAATSGAATAASGAAATAGATGGAGLAGKGAAELKRAEFYGAAELKHPEGILKGDAVVMDFFKPEAGRSQAIEHLLARGNVYAKSNPPPATPAGVVSATDTKKGPAKISVGDITCQKELDVHFTRDAAGNAQPKDLKASGAVNIKEPEGKILAENLDVRFGTSATGQTEAQFLDARGNVLIDRTDLYAEGDHILQNQATGEVLMEGRPEKPARARRGATRIVGPRIEFSKTDKDGIVAVVTGAGEMEMPSATDLRGIPHATSTDSAAASATGSAKAAKPTEPLIVRWTDRMQYVDKQNYALFSGGVRASTGGSGLNAGRLWIYFADKPPVEPVPGAPPKAAKAKSDATDPWGGFGAKDKDIVRVLAEKDVHTLDLQLAADKTVQSVLDMKCGDNLTYTQPPTTAAGGPPKGRISINGPGELQLLLREKTKAGEEAGVGLAPEAVAAAWKGEAPAGYSRTRILWTDRMAYEDATHRAYFEGNVDATSLGRSSTATAEADRTGKATIEMRIKSHDLQVIFAAKKPPAGTATGSTAVASTARPSGPQVSATPTDDRQAIDKMAASGNVFLWVGDRRGSADRMIYQKDPELLRLYCGTEDWARMWEENEAKQQFGEIVAETITYEPSTKAISWTGQKSLSGAPEAKPAPKTPPKSTSGKAGKGLF